MAYTTGTHSTSITLGQRTAELAREISDSYAKWRMYRTTMRALRQLSERELDDLGITRGDIHATAMTAVYGEI